LAALLGFVVVDRAAICFVVFSCDLLCLLHFLVVVVFKTDLIFDVVKEDEFVKFFKVVEVVKDDLAVILPLLDKVVKFEVVNVILLVVKFPPFIVV
jgi:hypothetical protein